MLCVEFAVDVSRAESAMSASCVSSAALLQVVFVTVVSPDPIPGPMSDGFLEQLYFCFG